MSTKTIDKVKITASEVNLKESLRQSLSNLKAVNEILKEKEKENEKITKSNKKLKEKFLLLKKSYHQLDDTNTINTKKIISLETTYKNKEREYLVLKKKYREDINKSKKELKSYEREIKRMNILLDKEKSLHNKDDSSTVINIYQAEINTLKQELSLAYGHIDHTILKLTKQTKDLMSKYHHKMADNILMRQLQHRLTTKEKQYKLLESRLYHYKQQHHINAHNKIEQKKNKTNQFKSI